MTKFGDALRQHISATGKFAKILTIVYFVMFYIINFVVIENNYTPANNGYASSLKNFPAILGVSILSLLIPVFISILHEQMYGVLLIGGYKKQKQAFLDKLDERQLEARRRIFEKSYAVLATLTMVAVFIGLTGFAANVPQDGLFIIGFNILMFVISLPSVVATWDKNVMPHLSISD